MRNPAGKNSAFRLFASPLNLAFLAATILLLGQVCLDAQEPTISVDVKVVNVLATVHDKHGQIVNNLSKDDFILQEDGRPQSIRYFSRESDLPLPSACSSTPASANGAFSTRNAVLATAFSTKCCALTTPRSSSTSTAKPRRRFRWRMARRRWRRLARRWWRSRRTSRWRRARRRGHRALRFRLSRLRRVDEAAEGPQGLLTDGVDRGSKETLDAALEAAQRADTVVYSILFKDDDAYSNRGGGGFGGRGGWGGPGGGRRYPQESRPDGKKIMERICQQTGGRIFEVSKKQPIDKIYTELQEELRNQYNLGYTPAKSDKGSGYRKIALTTKQKDLVVQAREGYYADR